MPTTPSDLCLTCGQRAEAPFRVIRDGQIVLGCVDVLHDAHLTPRTNSAHWAAKAAKDFKAAGLPRYSSVGRR